MMKLMYVTMILAMIASIALAAPYQELPPRAGHVPVYIRVGDTPLSEVNPKLVPAFHEEDTAKSLVEDKTQPQVVVPEAKEETQPKEEEKTNEGDTNKDDIMKAEEAKVEEVTASDIAEFDPIKPENEDIEIDNSNNNNEKTNE
uniref:Secreted protein n=1 Tax=Stomoxys calcitrans TaxID=35570 RepID=A0A1I8PJV0_STOCA